MSAGANTYTYDANGNMTTRNGSTIAWTSYNLPASLSAGGYTATFNYAPDRSRWRQVSTYAGATETTIYVGGMLEKLTTSVRVHWKHRIPTPSGEVQVIRRSDGTHEVLYATTDHLGSTDALMDAAGGVLVRESFGAWGARRGSNWSSSTAPDWAGIANSTRRGYTGHEQLDNIMLVHMNGRVYDPAIGRFLSADPYVKGIDASQGWNRYAYVSNRPLAFTDPSGYLESKKDQPQTPCKNGCGIEEITVWDFRDPGVAEAMQDAMLRQAFREVLSPPSIGVPANEDGMEQITVTATRPPPPKQPKPPGIPTPAPQGNALPCSAANNAGKGIPITLGYTNAHSSGATIPGANHTVVFAQDPATGASYASRGGPGSGPGGGPGIGPVTFVASAGSYNASFLDYGSVHGTQGVGYVDASFSQVTAYFDAFAATTNAQNGSYLGPVQNSNSYSGALIQGLGFNGFSPDLWAPGFSTNSPVKQLACTP